jgi:transketolase
VSSSTNLTPSNSKESSIASLAQKAKAIRKDVLIRTHETQSAHLGSCFSCVDLLTALYFAHLNVTPQNKTHPQRDRFVLSKGHACLALYCTLNQKGLLSKEVLDQYGINGGTLEHHSKYNLDYGIELSTGSLGHGLPVSCGMAKVGLEENFRVITLISDGELGEGSNWEAILFAGHHKLKNLTCIVDYNKIQAMGDVKDILNLHPLNKKFEAFNWKAIEVDGHNFAEILSALKQSENSEQPLAIIAHTVKGKGVSFMENQLLWHYRCPDPKELEAAIKELS